MLFNLGTYEVVLIVLAVVYVILVPLMSLLVARRTARRLAQAHHQIKCPSIILGYTRLWRRYFVIHFVGNNGVSLAAIEKAGWRFQAFTILELFAADLTFRNRRNAAVDRRIRSAASCCAFPGGATPSSTRGLTTSVPHCNSRTSGRT